MPRLFTNPSRAQYGELGPVTRFQLRFTGQQGNINLTPPGTSSLFTSQVIPLPGQEIQPLPSGQLGLESGSNIFLIKQYQYSMTPTPYASIQTLPAGWQYSTTPMASAMFLGNREQVNKAVNDTSPVVAVPDVYDCTLIDSYQQNQYSLNIGALKTNFYSKNLPNYEGVYRQNSNQVTEIIQVNDDKWSNFAPGNSEYQYIVNLDSCKGINNFIIGRDEFIAMRMTYPLCYRATGNETAGNNFIVYALMIYGYFSTELENLIPYL